MSERQFWTSDSDNTIWRTVVVAKSGRKIIKRYRPSDISNTDVGLQVRVDLQADQQMTPRQKKVAIKLFQSMCSRTLEDLGFDDYLFPPDTIVSFQDTAEKDDYTIGLVLGETSRGLKLQVLQDRKLTFVFIPWDRKITAMLDYHGIQGLFKYLAIEQANCEAMDFIDDEYENILKEIAQNSTDEDITKRAIEKINDELFLIRFVTEQKPPFTKSGYVNVAMNKIQDEELLFTILEHFGAESGYLFRDVMYRIKDPDLVKRMIFTQGINIVHKIEAITRLDLNDEELFELVSKMKLHVKVRHRALIEIRDPEVLADCYQFFKKFENESGDEENEDVIKAKRFIIAKVKDEDLLIDIAADQDEEQDLRQLAIKRIKKSKNIDTLCSHSLDQNDDWLFEQMLDRAQFIDQNILFKWLKKALTEECNLRPVVVTEHITDLELLKDILDLQLHDDDEDIDLTEEYQYKFSLIEHCSNVKIFLILLDKILNENVELGGFDNDLLTDVLSRIGQFDDEQAFEQLILNEKLDNNNRIWALGELAEMSAYGDGKIEKILQQLPSDSPVYEEARIMCERR